jgi:L-amino acid N-acyltransferase YncA
MKIRKAEAKDLNAINEIYNQAIAIKATADLEPISIQSRQKWFKDHNPDSYPVFVAEENGNVIGWLSFSAYRCGRKALRHTAEISYYIHEQYRREGIGSQLIKFALEIAISLHFKTLFAIILENNTPSIKLLEKFRFERWGLLPDIAEFDDIVCGHVYMGIRV